MNAEDAKVVIQEIEKALPALDNVKHVIDPFDGTEYFMGTDTDNRKVKFVATVKVIQITKKVKKEESE